MAWLSGWTYRKFHAITGSSGAGTNYQKRIIAHYLPGSDSGEDVYLNSKCKTDFGDIRFTDDDSTELDYWMESKVDSDYAIFWVEVADDLGSNQSIYIYYGKADATTTSNGTNTWDYFYDPETDSEGANPSGWTISEPSTTEISVSTEQAKFGTKSVKEYDPTSGFYCSAKKVGFSVTALRALFWIRPSQTNQQFSAPQIWHGHAGLAIYLSFFDDGKIMYYDGAWKELQGYLANTWYRIEIISQIDKADFHIKINDTWYNDKGLRGVPTAWDTFWLACATSPTPTFFWDIVCRGKYVEPEPAHGVWGEQEALNFVTNFEVLSITPQLNIQIEKLLLELLAFEDSVYPRFLYRTIILRETLRLAGKILPRARGIPISVLLPILKTVVYLITRKRRVLETKEDEG